MPAFKYPRTSQPQGVVEIADLFAAKPYNLLLPPRGLLGFTPAPNASLGVNARGVAFLGNNNNSAVKAVSNVNGYPFTVVLQAVFSSTANTTLCTIGAITGSGHRLQVDAFAGSLRAIAVGSVNAVDSVAISPGIVYTIVYVGDSATSRRLYVNGALVSSSTTSVTFTDTFTTFGVGAGFNQSFPAGTSYFDGSTSLVFAGQFALQDASARSVSSNPWQLFKPQSRTLWIPGTVAAGGASTVTSDASAAYSVRAAVTSDTGAAYALREAITSDATASYLLRTNATADASAAYAIRAPITSDTSASYSILTAGAVTSDCTASYGICGAVQSDASVAYELRGAVQSTMSVGYDIRVAVIKDASAAYALRGAVASDLAASYAVLALSAVTSSLTASYFVDGLVIAFVRATSRTGLIPAENRSGQIPYENRTGIIPAEVYSASI